MTLYIEFAKNGQSLGRISIESKAFVKMREFIDARMSDYQWSYCFVSIQPVDTTIRNFIQLDHYFNARALARTA